MHKQAVLSNGEMLVGLNQFGLVHDFYYPYVGQENLTTARSLPHKIGVWVDGNFSWLDDGSWQIELQFEDQALISVCSCLQPKLQVKLEIRSAVDVGLNAFLRYFQITNQAKSTRQIKLFIHQVFQISNQGRADTALYDPDGHYIFDYKGKTAIINYGRDSSGAGFDAHAIGNWGIEGKLGTWLDAEDGQLSGNNIEHGGVDSIIGFSCSLGPNQTHSVEYWNAAGQSHQEAEYIHRQLLKEGLIKRLARTRQFFVNWLKPAQAKMANWPSATRSRAQKSLLVIKAHMDTRGSIIASADSSVYNYGRDYYAYCWPRDGAYVVWPLIKLGYSQEPKAFFNFCARVAHAKGYLQHKFQPDGSFGSSWHPLIHRHHKELAIQEDETAIVLYVLADYVKISGDSDYFKKMYNQFVKPATDFLAYFVDAASGLPHASYDLWEEKFLTTSYTSLLVVAALKRMAELGTTIVKDPDAIRWNLQAEAITGNLDKLFDKKLGHYIKGLYLKESSGFKLDKTLDASSLYAAFMFGSKAEIGRIKQTATAIEQQLLKASNGQGLARYQGDNYLLTAKDSPGNPWFICSFWLIQYYLSTNQLSAAQSLLAWAEEHVSDSGLMSEQIDAGDGSAVGVSPLVWSHAEYLQTLMALHK